MNKLYKLDSKGKLRYWYAYATAGIVTTASGIVGSESTSEICESYAAKATNIGRANYRSSEQQALFEVDSLYKEKTTKKRYSPDMSEASAYVSQDVMLAHDYTKGKNASKIKWGHVDGQVKLDGVRCRITIDNGVLRAWSRENKPYILPECIFRDVCAIFTANPKLRSLDGEIYKHGMDFSDIVSRVKDVNHEDRESLEFWAYDTIETSMTWLERKELISCILNDDYGSVRLVASIPLDSVEEASKFLDDAVEHGFEGLILRNHKGLYKAGGRSYDLQKWKLFEDAEFKMVGIEIDKRGHAVFVFILPDKITFNARWKSSDAKRKYAAEHPDEFIDTIWTVRFQRYSQDGVPIFPVAITKRDYE